MPLFQGLDEAFAPATMIAGVAAGVLGVILGAIVLRSLFEAGDTLDSTVRLFGRPRRGAGLWMCGRCRSYSRDDQSRCYRGCGLRTDVELVEARLPAGIPRSVVPPTDSGRSDGDPGP